MNRVFLSGKVGKGLKCVYAEGRKSCFPWWRRGFASTWWRRRPSDRLDERGACSGSRELVKASLSPRHLRVKASKILWMEE